MIDCGAGTDSYGLIRVNVMVETGSIMVATVHLFQVPPLARCHWGPAIGHGGYLRDRKQACNSEH